MGLICLRMQLEFKACSILIVCSCYKIWADVMAASRALMKSTHTMCAYIVGAYVYAENIFVK